MGVLELEESSPADYHSTMKLIILTFALFGTTPALSDVMLVGGRERGSKNELMEPSFLSLNTSDPLSDCLEGSKNEIDGKVRRRPALFPTEGRSQI